MAPASSASSSGTNATHSKWKVVRPWQPPANNSWSSEAALEAGQEALESDLEDEDEVDNQGESDAHFGDQDHQEGGKKRRQLEVVDISSTSVSLAVFGAAEESVNTGKNQQHVRTASTSSEGPGHAHQPTSPNITIKLNSTTWPHFFHSDATLHDVDGTEVPDSTSSAASNILVWGLSPGVNYHIELGVFDEQDEGLQDEAQDADELSDEAESDEQTPIPATIRNVEAGEPDVPPPPYSSHDPSIPSEAQSDAELNLRNMLEQLRSSSKQAESSLQSSISALKRANDKLTREDQRHRQRIHMLEDSTARLREVAGEEDAESASVHEAIAELEETERSYQARLERRREQIETLEKDAKDENERDDAEMVELKARLEQANSKEEEVLARKLKLERELLPTYNLQLATLEADLRRMLDDHQRRQYMNSQGHHAYGLYQSPLVGPTQHGTAGRSASTRISNRNQQYLDPAAQAYSSYDGQALAKGVTHASHQALHQPRNASSFLPAGLRRRSASLTKPDNKPSSGNAGSAQQQPAQPVSVVEAESKPTSRFAWTTNTWASRVAGKAGSNRAEENE